ncbi:hypothetical protein [Nocardioides sp. SYSU DS0663]|uniref:protein kinase family protein n=1 Tax=Nocardioides sp. SYSU DS0663 TaxID=3416445 RepID=UPI003F4C8B0C
MPHTARPGDVLADRYRLVDLLSESRGGRFWRAHDRVLERHVALHVIDDADERATGLVAAARRSAAVLDRRVLRVLDAERVDGVCYVVNEWGSGVSLDILLATIGPLAPRKAAWLVGEVADTLATSHAAGVAHGRLVPENVLVERTGHVKVIGLCVDAALHGLPDQGTGTDVTDLAALLYAALTGRWAGASPSAVPAAPREHGHVLRPRQVRAGVPRPLDLVCEAVLNPDSGRWRDLPDLRSARGIGEHLAAFVGDPTGLPEALAADTPAVPRPGPIVLPPVPDLLPHDAEDPASDPGAGATGDAATDGPRPPASVELPTEAGLPIFDDEADEVAWLERRTEPVPPPPPFEEPPDRPLFAPDPADGTPLRRPRPGGSTTGTGFPAVGATGSSYWPWDTGHGTGTGAVVDPAMNLPDGGGAWGDHGAVPAEVPGRRWMRLAVVLGLCALVLLATVVAVNLGGGGSGLDDDPSPGPGSSGSADAAAPIGDVTATDLDPFGDPPEEYPDLAPLAVDGDPSTAWRTSRYEQQLGPSGLKTGVGLLLDLGSEREVAEVAVTLAGGGPADASVYVTGSAPTEVGGLDPVGTATLEPQGRVRLDEPASGRYVVVWLTSLPPVDGGFRADVAEVVVSG